MKPRLLVGEAPPAHMWHITVHMHALGLHCPLAQVETGVGASPGLSGESRAAFQGDFMGQEEVACTRK